jgi:uncharacterized protein YbcI
VRQYRLLFQKTVMHTTTAAIEELTGRAVIGHHSQLTFHPMRSFEIFVLDAPPLTADHDGDRRAEP